MGRHNEASTQRAAPSQSPSFQWKPLTLHGLHNVALFTPTPPTSPLPIAEKERARLLGKTDAECWRALRIILSPAPRLAAR